MARRTKETSYTKATIPSLIIGFIVFVAYEVVQQIQYPLITQPDNSLSVKAYFTPNHQCQTQIINFINSAEKEILMMCYAFTSQPLADALIKARHRGVSVKLIADNSQLTAPYSQIHNLKRAGVAVYIEHKVAIAHNKVIIVDEKKLITGSYNFTNAAQKSNAENIVIIHSAPLAHQYKTYWLDRQKVSKH